MAEMVVEQQQQNAVVRLINLPLVSSTYDMVFSVYVNTKDNHAYLKSVCEAAEKSVKIITSVAWTSATPILQKFEPQIAVANSIACVGLDKIEEKLPILYQPPEKVVANASEAVVVAKDAVVQSITDVVGKTKGAVHDGVELTMSVVNGSINSVLESSIVKNMSNHVDTAITKYDALVDQHLPLTDEELAQEANNKEGFEYLKQEASRYRRLGVVSAKACRRGYQQAMKQIKCKSEEAAMQLRGIMTLIDYGKQLRGDAKKTIYNNWMQWMRGSGQVTCGENETTEQIESHTLTYASRLAHQLQTTCLSLVASVQGVPQNIQDKAHTVSVMATDVYQNFHSASSFKEISDNVLTITKERFTKMKDSMDELMDYFVNNTPLNWLVPDFSINDLASETDANLEEEELEDFSRINGRVINRT